VRDPIVSESARLVGGRYRPAHAVRSARILRLLALTDVPRVVILGNTRLRGPFARPNTARIHSPPWHAGWFHGVVAQFDLARRLPWTPLPYFSSSSLCFLLPAVAFTAEAAGIKLTDVATAIQHVVAGILCSSALVSLRQKPMPVDRPILHHQTDVPARRRRELAPTQELCHRRRHQRTRRPGEPNVSAILERICAAQDRSQDYLSLPYAAGRTD
jgi:hypothetical protein